jgi:hypothetical protein
MATKEQQIEEEQLFDKGKITACEEKLFLWTVHNNIPLHHGWDHFQLVKLHGINALREQDPPLSKKQGTIILLACLLHDVDDRELFPSQNSTLPYPNTTKFLQDSGCQQYTNQVLKHIAVVATSTQGGGDTCVT